MTDKPTPTDAATPEWQDGKRRGGGRGGWKANKELRQLINEVHREDIDYGAFTLMRSQVYNVFL